MRTLLGLAIVAATLPSPPSAGEVTFDINPESPSSVDSVRFTASYPSTCAAGAGTAEVAGNRIRLRSFEACDCLPVRPWLVRFSTTVGPLAPGEYEVVLQTAPDPRAAGCDFEPVILATTRLLVADAIGRLRIEPPEPTTEDLVTLVASTGCIPLFDNPSRQGHIVRLDEAPSPVLAPCVDSPNFVTPMPLGHLPAGDYSALWFFDERLPGSTPRLVHQLQFAVRVEAGDELRLLGDRFHVTAEWTLLDGTSGRGRALPLSDRSGAFWFFEAQNLELNVKLVDGCDFNGRFWVFVSGTTDVGVSLRVVDTFTVEDRRYANPVGSAFETILDTAAFGCP